DGSTRDFEGARGVAIELDADRPEALGAAEEDLGRPFALDPGVPVRLARGTAQELEPEPVRGEVLPAGDVALRRLVGQEGVRDRGNVGVASVGADREGSRMAPKGEEE